MKKQIFLGSIGAGVGLVLTLGVGAGLSLSANAQPVLNSAQVTESALIDALALEPPEAASGAKTRGFRPATARAGEPAKPVNPNAGKASLLITFPSNSTDLTAETRSMLDTLARALESDKLAGFGFKVEGHADGRGEVEANLKLSQLRAQSVANYLVSQHGILAERLSAVGKGSSELLNKTQVDAPENRRVTIVTVKN